MLFVTQDELMKWKELDFTYISLESSYLLHACTEASLNVVLLELEPSVYILQLIEDVIFLFTKCIERVCQTMEETCIFAIGNKVLEMLYGHIDAETHCSQALLQEIVRERNLFRRCLDGSTSSTVKEVNRDYLNTIVSHCTGRVLEHAVTKNLFTGNTVNTGNGSTTPMKGQSDSSTAVTPKKSSNNDFNGTVSSPTVSGNNPEVNSALSVAFEAVEGWSTLWSEVATTVATTAANNMVDNVASVAGASAADSVKAALGNWLVSGWVLGDDLGEDESKKTTTQTYATPNSKKGRGKDGDSDEPVRPTIDRYSGVTVGGGTPMTSSRPDSHGSPLTPIRQEKDLTGLSMEELLLQALDVDEDSGHGGRDIDHDDGGSNYGYHTTGNDVYGLGEIGMGGLGARGRKLREKDWLVQLNSIAALVQAVQSLTMFLQSVEGSNAVFPNACIQYTQAQVTQAISSVQQQFDQVVSPPLSQGSSSHSKVAMLIQVSDAFIVTKYCVHLSVCLSLGI